MYLIGLSSVILSCGFFPPLNVAICLDYLEKYFIDVYFVSVNLFIIWIIFYYDLLFFFLGKLRGYHF